MVHFLHRFNYNFFVFLCRTEATGWEKQDGGLDGNVKNFPIFVSHKFHQN